MKYRFRRSNAPLRLPAQNECKKKLQLKGIKTLRLKKVKALAKNYEVEAFGSFDRESKMHIFTELSDKLRSAFQKWLQKEPRLSTASLWGFLGGASLVAVISGAVVLFSLFGKYGGSYSEIRIPNLTSLSAEKAVSVAPEYFEYEIIYKSNPDRESGTVVSQIPPADVVRKLYLQNGKLKITLTVNSEPPSIVLPELKSKPLREALLILKEAGMTINIREEYSSSVPCGNILAVSHPKGSTLKQGDRVTLDVSLGKEILYVGAPNLLGLGEQEAVARLNACGLAVGDISYKNSKEPIGSVISQSTAVGTPLAEGTKISFCISGGLYYSYNE